MGVLMERGGGWGLNYSTFEHRSRTFVALINYHACYSFDILVGARMFNEFCENLYAILLLNKLAILVGINLCKQKT